MDKAQQQQLQEALSRCASLETDVSSAVDLVAEGLDSTAEEARRRLNEHFAELQTLIDSRKEALLEAVDAVRDHKLARLKEQRTAIAAHKTRINASRDQVQSALTVPSAPHWCMVR